MAEEEKLELLWRFSRIPEIADFFKRIGEWFGVGPKDIGTRVEAWDEEQYERGSKRLAKLLTVLGANTATKNLVIKQYKASLTGSSPGGAVGSLMGSILNLIGLGPTIQSLNKRVWRGTRAAIRQEPIDPGSLLKYIWRFRLNREKNTFIPDTGWGVHEWEIFDKANRPWFDNASFGRMVALEDWDMQKFAHEVETIGWEGLLKGGKVSPEVKRLWRLTRQPPGLTELLDLWRRGELDLGAVDVYLKLLGFRVEERELIKRLRPRLLDVAGIVKGYYLGELDKPDTLKHMGKLGFDENTAQTILNYNRLPLSPFEATQAFRRDLVDYEGYMKLLERNGIIGEDAKAFERVQWVMPTPQDLVRFGVREVFTPAIRIKYRMDEDYPPDMTPWGKKSGLPEDVLKMYWAAHWQLPSPGQGFDMYHRGLISQDDLFVLLRALDVMPFWRDKMLGISHRLIPRRTLGRIIRQELLKGQDAVRQFRRLGFSWADADLMYQSELLRIGEDDKELTRAQVQDAYRWGFYTRAQATKALQDLGYSATAINYYILNIERKMALDVEADKHNKNKQEIAKSRELSKADILNGYADGLLDKDTAVEYLTGLEYSKDAATYLLDHADLEKAQKDLRFYASQVKRVFDRHLLNPPEATGKLITYGYTEPEARRIVRLWKAERDADDLLASVRDKLPSRTDLADWVSKGVVTASEWREGMERLGYGDEDILHYLEEIIADLGE